MMRAPTVAWADEYEEKQSGLKVYVSTNFTNYSKGNCISPIQIRAIRVIRGESARQRDIAWEFFNSPCSPFLVI